MVEEWGRACCSSAPYHQTPTMDESYERVKTILTNRRAELERVANALIAKETLIREEIDQLFGQSPIHIEEPQ
jgi:hypothetical protein